MYLQEKLFWGQFSIYIKGKMDHLNVSTDEMQHEIQQSEYSMLLFRGKNKSDTNNTSVILNRVRKI